MFAALLGGCVAIGGAGLLQYVGVLGSPVATNADFQQKLDTQSLAFDAQINELRSQLANNQSGPAIAETEEIVTQINETTLRVEQLMADQKANATLISKLEKAILAAGTDSGAGGGATVSALGLQVDNLSSQSTRLRGDLRQLKSELAKLSGSSNASVASTNPEINSRVSALESQFGKLPDMTPVLDSLRSGLATTNQTLEQQATEISLLRDKLEQPNNAEKLAARSVAAAALKSDIDRGLPFADSLDILKNLSPGDSSLTRLDDYANSGIPTSSQLSASFRSVGEAIVIATEPKPENDLTSRLLAGVKSFVRVKARKPIEGTTPLAIVSQIAESLEQGDLYAASALWNTLPEPGQNVSQDWHRQVQSRIVADELISNSVQSFLSSTATQ